MSVSVGKIYDLVEEYAPWDLAFDGDNVGLIVGSKHNIVSGIVFAVDVNIGAIEMAKEIGANLIIAHHPVIFEGISCITDETATGKVLYTAIKNDISVICAHTNLDAADGGISQTLAELAGLEKIHTHETENVMKIGELEKETSIDNFVGNLKDKLNIDTVFVSKNYPEIIKTVAVVSGRGCSLIHEAKSTGADAFLLGEIKHENAVYADILDLCVICCGHHETEVIILDKLKTYLQNRLNKLQLSLGIYMDAPMVKK